MYQNLLRKNDLITSTSTSMNPLWLVHDLMSIQMLLGIISQMLTMLRRDQTWNNIRSLFSSIYKHPSLYKCGAGVLIIHTAMLLLRAWMRGGIANYAEVPYVVWIMMSVTTIAGIFVGLAVNSYDNKKHQQTMQFLRLDFDTKLGMHSPR